MNFLLVITSLAMILLETAEENILEEILGARENEKIE
jgi:hypothetical protein